MKRLFPLLLICLLPACLTSCADLHTLTQARAIDREIQIDRLKFYEKMRDAYFLLGYEYYTLAKEAEERKDAKRAEEYSRKAALYDLFQKDIKRTADQMRDLLLARDNEFQNAPAAAPAQSAPPPPAAASQPIATEPLP
jgi:hypothetical protein